MRVFRERTKQSHFTVSSWRVIIHTLRLTVHSLRFIIWCSMFISVTSSISTWEALLVHLLESWEHHSDTSSISTWDMDYSLAALSPWDIVLIIAAWVLGNRFDTLPAWLLPNRSYTFCLMRPGNIGNSLESLGYASVTCSLESVEYRFGNLLHESWEISFTLCLESLLDSVDFLPWGLANRFDTSSLRPVHIPWLLAPLGLA